jgi:hypothetical protein
VSKIPEEDHLESFVAKVRAIPRGCLKRVMWSVF